MTAHEMAHLIDARVPALSREWRNNSELRKELKTVSYDKNSVTEGWAESVRLWMTQPDVLQAKAPLVHRLAGELHTVQQAVWPGHA